MTQRMVLSLCAMACLFFGALSAEANFQSERWFHEVTQDGRDVHFTLQLIDGETSDFDTTYKLTRGDKLFFEHKQFVRGEADEVFGPGCIELLESEENADCNDDGLAECTGICGTAYRYEYLDECVPDDHPMYTLWDESTFDESGNPPATGPDSEGHWHIVDFVSTDDSCLDSGCSTSPAVGTSSEAFVAALMLLAGLACVVVARRRKRR